MRIINFEEIERVNNDILYCLNNDGVIIYPTDTIYGLGCSSKSEIAISRIYELKNRAPEKSLLVLINGWKMLDIVCEVSKKQSSWLKNICPGPSTVILPVKNKLANNLNHKTQTIAVRWPNNEWLNKIITELGHPLVSTSCNISNSQHAKSVFEIEKTFNVNMIDLVIDAGILDRKPSSIFDLTTDEIKIIRK